VSEGSSLSPLGRAWRAAVLLATSLGLVIGTFWGDDDNFPFGPFRMFSTTNTLDGHVDSGEIWAETASGEVFQVEWTDIGLRRAEIEGQMQRFIEDPDALRFVAEAYAHFVPDGPELVAIEFRESRQILRDGRPYGEPEVALLARWEREG
jgi:hypothetical protein